MYQSYIIARTEVNTLKNTFKKPSKINTEKVTKMSYNITYSHHIILNKRL